MARKLPEIDPFATIPTGYRDLRAPVNSDRFREGARVLARAEPVRVDAKGKVTAVTMRDPGGYFLVRFLKWNSYTLKPFCKGSPVYLYGEPRKYRDGWVFYHPEIPREVGRIFPVYRKLRGISAKRLREHVLKTVRALLPELEDEVSRKTLRELGLPPIREALSAIHDPREIPDETPLIRLAFRELHELVVRARSRPRESAPVISAPMEGFHERLPLLIEDPGGTFGLTADQKAAIAEILDDMASGKAMRRLLQGDVNTGKTVVAMAAAYACVKSNYRVLVLAPTTVVARQTCEKFRLVFGDETVGLWTGREKTGQSPITVGTHALLDGTFPGVALVVIDEQQKFGVDQRNMLLGNVHALQMTATPIPRTFGLLFHGSLQMSELRVSPHGRRVRTRVVTEFHKVYILGRITKTVSAGGKALVIYPLVDEGSENYRSLNEARKFWEKRYPGRVLFTHGRDREKEKVVETFRRNGDKSILVATSLMETGLDVPEASLMVVVGAERFGLSQLHQLRGRIGRRGVQAECYLLCKKKGSLERLRRLETTEDGFEIARVDADIRGWGNAFGREQSGHCFKLPSIGLYQAAAPLVLDNLGLARRRGEDGVMRNGLAGRPEEGVGPRRKESAGSANE